MSYKINYGDGAVCLPAAALDGCGELLQLRLLMLLSYDRSLCNADDTVLAEHLGCTLTELSDTVAALRAVRLLEPEKKPVPSAQTKNLAGEEIAAVLNADRDFKQLIDECQNICGRIFTPTDISKLVSIKQELGFDGETILLLFFYYAEKLSASDRRLSVSYIEKSAYTLYNQNVRDLADLQEYIKRTEEKNRFGYKIRRLFGIGDRTFTKKESRFFDKWNIEWHIPYELIEYAYDITVDATGKPALDYMSKILSGWHENGITTLEQAEKSSDEYKKSDKYQTKFREKAQESPVSSFNTDEFFEKALQKSYAMINSEKGTGKED